jgi:hypothetical protein
MPVYLVDRDLPGITLEQLVAAQQAVNETSKRYTAAGKPVRYLRSTFVPEEARCVCLFEAMDPATVQEVNAAAGIPFSRIVLALDLDLTP